MKNLKSKSEKKKWRWYVINEIEEGDDFLLDDKMYRLLVKSKPKNGCVNLVVQKYISVEELNRFWVNDLDTQQIINELSSIRNWELDTWVKAYQ